MATLSLIFVCRCSVVDVCVVAQEGGDTAAPGGLPPASRRSCDSHGPFHATPYQIGPSTTRGQMAARNGDCV